MRICVLGAGGLGSLLGGGLAEAGVDVTLVGRAPHVEAIRGAGLRIGGIRGERTVRGQLEAVVHPDEARGEYDALILLVKAKDTAAALAAAHPLRERLGVALSFQNALAKEQWLADWIGRERVIGAATTEAATLEGAGFVRHVATAPTSVYLGELDGGASARVAALTDAFTKAGFPARPAEDIAHVEWEKLLQIMTVSAWSVTTTGVMPGGSVAEALVVREAAEHYVQIATELLAVYRAMGYEPRDFFHPFSRFRELERWSFEEAVRGMMAAGQEMLDRGVIGRPSLHVDLLRGRETEVEHGLTPFLAKADELGIPVPTVRASYRVIKTLEQMLT